MIERKNIIRLIGDRTNVYHSALLTTYSFDPIYFESVYLSTLRKLGITNVVVLMDANMYDQLLADSDYQYHRVAQDNYTLVRQENTHSGVFHPKMVILLGEEEGAFIVGSGNLTYSGLSNNEEVWNVFHVMGNESLHYPLLHQAWKYLTDDFVTYAPLVHRQMDWMLEQSPWLQKESNDDLVSLASEETCQLLLNTSNHTILNSLYDSIGDKEIDSITVVAPFYDTEGDAIKELQRHFSPKEMRCVLDLNRQSAPYSLLQENTSVIFEKSISPNPLHAKIVELQSKDETWFLCGSANAGNMALGTSSSAYNDEACVLLHSNTKRNYIKDLAIQYTEISVEEQKSITRPQQEKKEKSTLKVKLFSCEEKENKLWLRFSKENIEGTIVVLDNDQNIVFTSNLTTCIECIVDVGIADVNNFHIAVLKDGEMEISNRILIIREINVERGNPDPKRRKLSSLLDDSNLLENIGHILGYIEFDNSRKHTKANITPQKKKEDNIVDDVIVSRDRFNALKDSTLTISMHSGVRILSYLQHFLFKSEENERKSDDSLLSLKEEGCKEESEIEYDENVPINSEFDDACRLRSDITNYLKRMLESLLKRTNDQSILGDVNPAISKPRLMAVPDLNEASSIAIAATSVICLMNKYSSYLDKLNDLRDLFIKCAGVFLSLYANRIPDNSSLRERKVRELLKDATVEILSSLCFFSYSKDNSTMIQLVLNCLEAWKNKEEQNNLIPLFEEQIQKFNLESINEHSVKFLRKVVTTYLKEETPLKNFTNDSPIIYQLRNGYGFLILDNIKQGVSGWNFSFHSPWFDGEVVNFTIPKYKGYTDF